MEVFLDNFFPSVSQSIQICVRFLRTFRIFFRHLIAFSAFFRIKKTPDSRIESGALQTRLFRFRHRTFDCFLLFSFIYRFYTAFFPSLDLILHLRLLFFRRR